MDTSPNIKTVFENETVKGGMRKETTSFTWEIKNYDVVRNSEDLIKAQRLSFSAGVSVNFKSEWEFRLELSEAMKAPEDEEQMWIGCFLVLIKAPVDSGEVLASWQLEIKSTGQGRGVLHGSDQDIDKYAASEKCGFSCVFLQTQKLKHLPLKNGNLVMELTMQLYAPQPALPPMKVFEDASSIEERYKPKFFEKLQQDLLELVICPPEVSHGTKTFVMEKDKVEFKVISNVLSLRSPVFRRMFETKMTEATTGIVRITDISSKTMTVLLSFLYTAKLQPEWRHPDVITELLYVAAKYELPDLLKFLDEVVGSVCTKETAGKLMNITRKLSLKKAENDLWEFVKKNIASLDEMTAFTKDADRAIGHNFVP